MNITEYQKIIHKFDKYPKDKLPESYLYGLADESGELIDKINMILFERVSENHTELILELGDVRWYFVSLLNYFGISFEDIEIETKKYPTKKQMALMQRGNNLMIHVSKLLGIIKKILRDNNGKIGYTELVKIRTQMIMINVAICDLENYYNFKTEKVLEENYNKLSSRLKRNKIHGSGDNR